MSLLARLAAVSDFFSAATDADSRKARRAVADARLTINADEALLESLFAWLLWFEGANARDDAIISRVEKRLGREVSARIRRREAEKNRRRAKLAKRR